MRLPQENKERHVCLKCVGKARHIETTSNKVYCAYCHRSLLKTQVHEEWSKLIEEILRWER